MFLHRKYIKGKVKYIDLLDMDKFFVHDIDEIMESLNCINEGKLLYYHFKKPFSDLDVGLYALTSDNDINHLSTFVGKHKLIDVYTEHGQAMLHTYFVSPNPNRIRIHEIVEPLVL